MPARVDPLQLKVSVPSRLAAAASSFRAALISWAGVAAPPMNMSATTRAIVDGIDVRAGTESSRVIVVRDILVQSRAAGLAHDRRLSPRLAIGLDRDPIVHHGRGGGDITRVEITLDQLDRALARRPMAAATAGLDADQVTRLQRVGILLLDTALLRLARLHQGKPSGLGPVAALHAPGRILGAVE